jgi:hypothetical protein
VLIVVRRYSKKGLNVGYEKGRAKASSWIEVTKNMLVRRLVFVADFRQSTARAFAQDSMNRHVFDPVRTKRYILARKKPIDSQFSFVALVHYVSVSTPTARNTSR